MKMKKKEQIFPREYRKRDHEGKLVRAQPQLAQCRALVQLRRPPGEGLYQETVSGRALSPNSAGVSRERDASCAVFQFFRDKKRKREREKFLTARERGRHIFYSQQKNAVLSCERV